MAQQPMPPSPPLDGAPPSPPGLGAQQQPQGMSGLVPTPNTAGNIQVIQLGLQTAEAVAKGLDLLAQIFPGFAPTAAMLQSQLRAGFKSAIQQGAGLQPEPSTPQFGLGMMSAAQQEGSVPPPQTGLPPLPSGM